MSEHDHVHYDCHLRPFLYISMGSLRQEKMEGEHKHVHRVLRRGLCCSCRGHALVPCVILLLDGIAAASRLDHLLRRRCTLSAAPRLHRETSMRARCDEQYRLAHHTPKIKIFPSIHPEEEEEEQRDPLFDASASARGTSMHRSVKRHLQPGLCFRVSGVTVSSREVSSLLPRF